jgi:hypothetical protein
MMVNIDIHNVVSVEKSTRIFPSFALHRYTFKDSDGAETVVNAFTLGKVAFSQTNPVVVTPKEEAHA